MAENSGIEWTTHTFNPWMGCTAVSPGCDNCYAERMIDKRLGKARWGNNPRVRTSESNWKQPLKWAAKARDRHIRWQAEVAEGRYSFGRTPAPPERQRVFCASLADVFDNQAPQEWREDLWTTIEATPELDWLLLTKRPQNIRDMIPRRWAAALPRHIWLGMTAENQTEYDRRWPHLEKIDAAVRFVSYEPALGPLQIPSVNLHQPPNWIICGGEDRAREGRPMHHEVLTWARELRDRCKIVGTAFFFKQTVGKGEIPFDLQIRQFPHRP